MIALKQLLQKIVFEFSLTQLDDEDVVVGDGASRRLGPLGHRHGIDIVAFQEAFVVWFAQR